MVIVAISAIVSTFLLLMLSFPAMNQTAIEKFKRLENKPDK
jgi:hypothetical protein